MKYLPNVFGTWMIIALLAGCGAPAAASTATQQPPPPRPNNPLPPPPLKSPMPPPTPMPTPSATGQAELFRFVRDVQVTPDQNFTLGGFPRINYVPATDRFFVAFAVDNYVRSALPVQCKGAGIAYKEYSMEMQETGKSGRIIWDPAVCQAGDMGYTMVGNDFYAVWRAPNWHLLKIDAVSWKTLAEITIPLDSQTESPGDPMVVFVNNQLDISGQSIASGMPGDSTHHHFFTADLQPLGKKVLADTKHMGGSAMAYVDGIYYFVSANNYFKDLILMKYDKDWKYLGEKTLIKQANFSTGMAHGGGRFYVAYADTSLRTEPGFMPVYVNIHLAAFDSDWNLLEDLAVTKYTVADNMQTGHPWVILHGNRLYVSYDVDTRDPVTHEETGKGQGFVSVYDVIG